MIDLKQEEKGGYSSEVQNQCNSLEGQEIERICEREICCRLEGEQERTVCLRRKKKFNSDPIRESELLPNASRLLAFLFILAHLIICRPQCAVHAYYNSIQPNQTSITTNSKTTFEHHLSHNQQGPPSQLFLSPASISRPANLPQISLVEPRFGVKKKTDEEEDGFIMKTPSSTPTQTDQTNTEQAVTTDTSATLARDEELSNEKTPTTTITSDEEQNNNENQRIPIDVNRPQFITHDQLSLLNATTKDEQIHLDNGNSDPVGQQQEEGSQGNLYGAKTGQLPHSTSSRAGMSKVSHVSSFLSDFFAYATRPRQEEEQATGVGSNNKPQAAAAGNNRSPQKSQLVACPGICRSILTASILCRNEINAACPSFLQKCCEKDDAVSFNGTPVETSAPLPTTDTDIANTAQVSDSLSQAQEQTLQTTNPTTTTAQSPITTVTPKEEAATSTSAAAASHNSNPSGTTKPKRTEQHQSVDLLLAPINQHEPSSIYFLSSGNESESSPPVEQQHQATTTTPTEILAQSTNEERQNTNKLKNSASQSFDSVLESRKTPPPPLEISTQPSTSTTASKSNQFVVLQTLNGTIIHQPNAAAHSRRPAYANWTDYHLSMLQSSRLPVGPPLNIQQQQQQQQTAQSQNVVYHSNIDPAKRFSHQLDKDYESSTTMTSQQQTSLQNQDLITLTENNKRSEPSSPHENDRDGGQLKVMNDQHSSSAKPKNPSNSNRQQESMATSGSQRQLLSTITTTSTSTTTTTTTSTTPPPSSVQDLATSDQMDQQQQQPPNPISGVGNVLVDLIDSWLSGSSGSSTSSGQEDRVAPSSGGQQLDSHQTNHVALLPENPSELQNNQQQMNDRRLGYDLSFRQQQQHQQPQQQDSNSSQPDLGLMTSDGASEQMLSSPSSSDSTLNSNSNNNNPAKCAGFCAMPLFTMLCDSAYRSADCGPSQRCCVQGKLSGNQNPASAEEPESSGGQALNQVAEQAPSLHHNQQQANNPFRQQQQSPVCRGSCLPMYHSSLCTRPNELQLDSPGCLANFVCCSQPPSLGSQEVGAGGINHLDDLDNPLLNSPSVSPLSIGADQTAAQSQLVSSTSQLDSPHAANSQMSIKDNSLFASLMPPPPPTLPIMPAPTLADQQLMQEKNAHLSDQYLAATARHRQGALVQDSATGLNPYQSMQFSRPQQTPAPPTSPKSSSSGGGIMSQLYQMFKSNGANKQRPQQQQQPIPSQVNVPILNRAPQMFMNGQSPQLFEQSPFQQQQPAQSAPTSHLPRPQPNFNPQQQQQLMFANSPMIAQGSGQQPQQLYPTAEDLGGLMELKAHQQVRGGNRQQQAQFVQQPQHQLDPTFVAQSHTPLMGQNNGNNNNNIQNQANLVMQNNNNQKFTQQHKPLSYNPQAFIDQAQQQQQPPSQLMINENAKQFGQDALMMAVNFNHHHPQQTPLMMKQTPQQQQQKQSIGAGQQQPTQMQFAGATNKQQQSVPNGGQRYQFNNNLPTPDNAHHLVSFNQQSAQKNFQQQQQPLAGKQQFQYQQPITKQQVANKPTAEQSSRPATSNGIQQQQMQMQPVRSPQQSEQRFTAASAIKNTDTLQQPLLNNNSNQKSPSSQRQQNQPAIRQQQQQQQHSLAEGSEQPKANQQQKVDLNKNNNRPSAVVANGGVKVSAVETQPTLGSLTPSSSNINVLISSTPYVDLKRVNESESNAKSGQRRQQSNRIKPATGEDEELSQATCPPSNCFAPFLSFSCEKPNQIDERLACGSPGAVCCMPKPDRSTSSSSSSEPNLSNSQLVAAGSSSLNHNKDLNRQTLPNVATDTQLGSQAAEDNNNRQELVQAQSNEQADQSSATDSQPLLITTNDLSASALDSSPQEDRISKTRVQATSCGLPGPRRQRSTSGQGRGRVMGGFDAKPDYWCWQAALMNNKNEYLCGGALIGTKWVLTAAHCVTQHLRNENQLFVRLGQHNLNSSLANNNARTIQVKTSYVHHNHNGMTLDNDIALLRLAEPVDLDESGVCLICLPERSSQMEPGKRCTVTGYGFETESGPAALRVRQTDLPIVADQECQKRTSSVLGKPFTLPASSFCAGGELGEDACHGDGGSPLSCLVDGYYELAGIVSWGYKCGSKDLPGLYSKVSTFVGWINQIVSVNI